MELVVHIDFKGLPLTPEHVCDRLAVLRSLGATGVILEWEDLFPYHGELAALRSPHAFTPDEVGRVVATAQSLGLEVVPLVQTIGHLEFALKHEAFAALREDPTDFGTLCPALPEAAAFVRGLVAQVVALHPHSRRVHIGCDEPTLGVSSATVAAAQADADGLGGVLADHVVRTCAAIRQATGAARGGAMGALMWHDAAASMADACLGRLLASGVRCVCWDYRPCIEATSPSITFAERLLRRGASPYVATAYKGGDTCDAVVPNRSARAANQRVWKAWVEIAPSWAPSAAAAAAADAADGAKQAGAAEAKAAEAKAAEARGGEPSAAERGGAVAGVVLTGWSRFGHLMPLTEMLPAGWGALLDAISVWAEASPDAAGAEAAAAGGGGGGESGGGSSHASVYEELGVLCEQVAAARAELSALELEWKCSCAPATARQAAPKLVLKVRAESTRLAEALAALGRTARVRLPGSAIFRSAVDVEEWCLAKIDEAASRAEALRDTAAHALHSTTTARA